MPDTEHGDSRNDVRAAADPNLVSATRPYHNVSLISSDLLDETPREGGRPATGLTQLRLCNHSATLTLIQANFRKHVDPPRGAVRAPHVGRRRTIVESTTGAPFHADHV